MSESFGLPAAELQEIKNILVLFLAPKSKYSVSVFGSRALGKSRQYSDLDLWLETEPALNPSEIAELGEIFQDSNISIKIDLVTADSCLEEYRSRILNENKLWFKLD